jgi:hypothetical protein
MSGIYKIIETPNIKKECVSVINNKIKKIDNDVIERRKSGLVQDFIETIEDYLYAIFLHNPLFMKFNDDGTITMKGSTFNGNCIEVMKMFADWIAPYTEDGKLVFTNYYSYEFYFTFKDGVASDVVRPAPTGIPSWKLE